MGGLLHFEFLYHFVVVENGLRNGLFYCKVRQVSHGKFEAKTKKEHVKNNCIIWNKAFSFDVQIPDEGNGTLGEAKIRISVRKDGSVGKSEVKLGYLDVSTYLKISF